MTAPAQPLGVAVLGAWHVHAGDYARRAQEHPGTRLVAVWDDDAERGRALTEEFSVELVEDLDELLARDDVDAVTVTTATSAHRDVIGAAVAAGRHVFTEKLLAPTTAAAEELVAAADARGVRLVVSLPRLHHGYVRAILDVLEGGGLGRLTSTRVRLAHAGALQGWLPERFFDPVPAIGGALTDLGCHPVYLTQLLLGAVPESVTATYRSVTGRAVEDSAVVTAAYGDQAVGVIEAGFVGGVPFTVEVAGTGGTLVYADGVLRMSSSASGGASGDGGWRRLEVPPDSEDPFSRWVGHVAAGTRADDNLARAVELTRLVVAANTAAATGTATRP